MRSTYEQIQGHGFRLGAACLRPRKVSLTLKLEHLAAGKSDAFKLSGVDFTFIAITWYLTRIVVIATYLRLIASKCSIVDSIVTMLTLISFTLFLV